MPFGLKNASAIFSRVVVAVSKEFIHKFLEVYLDDWIVFRLMDEILRRYVLEHEQRRILEEAHVVVIGGYYAGKAIAQKVLTVGLWWPTIHKYAMELCRTCDVYQRIGKPSRRDEIPLKPQITLQAFEKWSIGFVGPINPPGKRTGARYIITVIDYLTRWAEVALVKECSVAIVAQFIFVNILTRFSYPCILMSDQGTHFLNQTIQLLTEEFQIYR